MTGGVKIACPECLVCGVVSCDAKRIHDKEPAHRSERVLPERNGIGAYQSSSDGSTISISGSSRGSTQYFSVRSSWMTPDQLRPKPKS